MSPGLRSALTAAGLAALLVASGAVSALTPQEAQWEQPFAVDAAFDQQVTGRNIVATVHGAVVADEVSTDSWSSGDGSLWVVADTSVEAVTTEAFTNLSHAALVIDGVTFTASDRAGYATLRQQPLSVGIPLRGMLAFEIPLRVLEESGAADAKLQLALSADPRLDSMIVVEIDLTALTHDSSATLTEPSWGRA